MENTLGGPRDYSLPIIEVKLFEINNRFWIICCKYSGNSVYLQKNQ